MPAPRHDGSLPIWIVASKTGTEDKATVLIF
jgi:hypothetical protein